MKTIAVYNIKGGVGKTATAVNLAYLAAREGRRCLVWDLDPQAAATFYFRVKPKIRGKTSKLLTKKGSFPDQIKATDFPGLDLVPADFAYRHLDLEMDAAGKPGKRLRRLLRPLAEEYDLVWLDCPPSVSLLSEAVFEAADALLVPTIPTPLSLRTLDQLARHLKQLGVEVRVLPFFSQVDRRKRLHREIVDSPGEAPFPFLSAAVGYASEVEQMGLHRGPLPAYAPRGSATRAYENLWREVTERLELPQGP